MVKLLGPSPLAGVNLVFPLKEQIAEESEFWQHVNKCADYKSSPSLKQIVLHESNGPVNRGPISQRVPGIEPPLLKGPYRRNPNPCGEIALSGESAFSLSWIYNPAVEEPPMVDEHVPIVAAPVEVSEHDRMLEFFMRSSADDFHAEQKRRGPVPKPEDFLPPSPEVQLQIQERRRAHYLSRLVEGQSVMVLNEQDRQHLYERLPGALKGQLIMKADLSKYGRVSGYTGDWYAESTDVLPKPSLMRCLSFWFDREPGSCSATEIRSHLVDLREVLFARKKSLWLCTSTLAILDLIPHETRHLSLDLMDEIQSWI